jgi:replicative DNA helicase
MSNQLIKINQRRYGDVYRTITQGGEMMFERIDRIRNNNGEVANRLPSKFYSVTHALGGGYLEGWPLVAGAGGVGKTTLLLSEAASWVEKGMKVVFHSLEMKLLRLAYSYYAALSRIPVLDIENVQVDDAGLERLVKIMSEKSSCPFFIDDEHGLTIDQIIMRAKTMKSMGKCDILLVDSLKAIKWSKRHYGMSKKDVWEDMIDDLRNFGTNNGVYVILIHHFNRGYQKRSDRWPNWGDMEHISQDKPDCIAFLFSVAKAYQWDRYADVIEYLVPEKNRGGAAGVRELLSFQPEYGLYTELDGIEASEYQRVVDEFRRSKKQGQEY